MPSLGHPNSFKPLGCRKRIGQIQLLQQAALSSHHFWVLTSRFFQWETLIQLFLNVNLNKQFETVGICVSVVSS